MEDIVQLTQRLRKGGDAKYHEKNAEVGKLFARERIERLLDKGSFVEDGLFANCKAEGLPADGVVTGLGRVQGRKVALMANDSTVKAGSWGARTVEKILRIQETAEKLEIPLFYLVDSAGARITDQVEMFPGRRGAGRIFFNEANLSGKIPQICLLFGPSAAGGAYIPAFCDVLIMVEGNASMYLGSPRMAEMVIGEKVTLEEMGGARMHCSVSGCGDFLVASEDEAIALAKRYLAYMPQSWKEHPAAAEGKPSERPAADLKGIIPPQMTRAYDMKEALKTVLDKDSFLEVKALYAKEVVVGFGRVEGMPVGIVANQPMVKGGVLFVDSSDKAARFIQLCSAFHIPLLFFADVPGYMIGSKVEREGMIRAGAKLIYAMSTFQGTKISVLVRKAYGAGLYAMSGPAFAPDCVIALPSAQMAVMGPEPAVNAVYFNKMAEMSPEQKKAFMAEKIAEYEADIDLLRQAGELIVDQVIDFAQLRSELALRLGYYRRSEIPPAKRPGIVPM
jgi:methylmalonyl-CoA decarboxylase subunit alpha